MEILQVDRKGGDMHRIETRARQAGEVYWIAEAHCLVTDTRFNGSNHAEREKERDRKMG